MASTNGKARAERGQGPRRDHRRRQLRELAAPGRRVLQGRAGRQVRPRPHARQPRRLPRPRRRVRRRVRRDEGQGRQGPRRRDLGAPERHDQVRRRPEDRRHGHPRDDARRHRQVPLAGRREGAGRDRRRRRDPQGAQRRRRRQLPPGRLGDGDEVVRRADPRRRLRDGELHARVHRAASRTGSAASSRPACRSSATTSSRRSARRSRTACSRRSSASAACTSTRRCS